MYTWVERTSNTFKSTINGSGMFTFATATSQRVHRYPFHDIGYNSRTDRCRQKTKAGWEEKARTLSGLAAETEEQKKALIAGRGSRADILEASERLKSIRDEIAATRRFLEPLVMSCPFCLWNCSPLFSAEDAEADAQREREDRAACSSPETMARKPESVDNYVSPLADVMGSVPLTEAFGAFCQREFCSEVTQKKTHLQGQQPLVYSS